MAMQAAISDEQITALIPRCQRGESAAVEELYDLYADRLYRYLLARTGDPDVAAELTTELFLRVIKKIGGFRLNAARPTASFSAWLYRIAGNLTADYYRKRRRQPLEVCLEDQLTLPARIPDPECTAEAHELSAQLAQALEGLGEEQRLVVIGKFGDNMSNLQIAHWLGKTEGAVKSLQHRALRALGRLLEPEEA